MSPASTRRITRIFTLLFLSPSNFFLLVSLLSLYSSPRSPPPPSPRLSLLPLSSFSVARRRPIELKQIASISGKLLSRRVTSYILCEYVQSSINSGRSLAKIIPTENGTVTRCANTFEFYRYFNQRPLGLIMPYIIHREGDSSWSAPLPSIRFVGDVDRPLAAFNAANNSRRIG